MIGFGHEREKQKIPHLGCVVERESTTERKFEQGLLDFLKIRSVILLLLRKRDLNLNF